MYLSIDAASHPGGLQCSKEILLEASSVFKRTLTLHPKDEAVERELENATFNSVRIELRFSKTACTRKGATY
jgi:hypothetical protein